MEWEKIDQWLQQKFAPKPVPSFERNEESFKVLSALVEANQQQDAYARSVLEDTQYYAHAYQAEGEGLQMANRVFGLDKSSLSPQASSLLDLIVDLAMLLGLDSVSLPSFQQALLHHVSLYILATQQERRSQTLQARLDNHLTQAKATLLTLQNRVQPRLSHQWEEVDQVQIKIWQRHTDLLHQKVEEYQRQLQDIRTRTMQQQQKIQRSANNESNNSIIIPNSNNTEVNTSHDINALRLSSLQALQNSIQDLELQLEDRNKALAIYTELPPDYKLARLKLSEAKFRLEQLLIEQESLMQDLADGL
ncbi:HAUS augmin-like complex subunit 1 [Actinomortierella wolfii]|nr:HAUS augmin-like complex subunit 1 [Actinomortierella wolfii]